MSLLPTLHGRRITLTGGAGMQGTAVVERNFADALSVLPQTEGPPHLAVVLRGTVSDPTLLRTGAFVTVPQNAWAYTRNFSGLAELKRKFGILALTSLAGHRGRGVIRISTSIPTYHNELGPVIPNVLDSGFDALALELETASSPRSGTQPVISCVGSLTSYRGLGTVTEAAKLLGAGFSIRISGPPQHPGTVETLRKASNEVPQLRISDHRLDRHEALSALHTADVVVLPSTVEASPVSLLEAIALGQRVVASNIAGHREIVEQAEVEPIWFEPGDATSLVNAIELSLEHAPPRSPIQDQPYRRRLRESWASSVLDQLCIAASR